MTTQDERRESAIRQLNEKRGFRGHLVVYLLVITMLIVIWPRRAPDTGRPPTCITEDLRPCRRPQPFADDRKKTHRVA